MFSDNDGNMGPDDAYIESQFSCGCNTERVMVSLWKDEPYPAEVYFSMWYMAGCHPENLTWRHRLRHIRRIIKHGSPYLDDVTMTEKEARQLGEWLVKHVRAS